MHQPPRDTHSLLEIAHPHRARRNRSTGRTDHFRESQHPGVPPQQEALRSDTDLVTATLGANDTKIAAVAWTCLLGFVAAPGQQESCAKLVREDVQQQIDALPAKLDAVIAGIKQASREQ